MRFYTIRFYVAYIYIYVYTYTIYISIMHVINALQISLHLSNLIYYSGYRYYRN